MQVRGFTRVAIEQDGKIVGDSGFNPVHNMITNEGIEDFLAQLLAAQASSKQVGFVSLGSGAAPASNATALPGEVLEANKRVAPTYAFTQRTAAAATATVQFTATFASGNSFISTTFNISNIGLFNASTTGTLFAGNTYASSSCASNQNVNTTYEIQFSF
jgi:hypothetical protein